MAINFPDSPTNGQQTSAGGNTWQYNSTKSVWEKTLTSGRSSAGITTYANISDLPLSGVSAGEQAFVTGSNRMYINNGSGWYSISLVNTNPNITSVADASSGTTPFTLATDQTATVITITAADPEEVPLTYGYSVTSGSLNGSTVAQGTGNNTNVFTVTPHASQDTTFTLTFTASDGINQATSANAFSLSFVTVVTDSNHTTLLATATGTSDNNNITDASTNNHSITVNGDAHAGTFSPYRSGGYSWDFDGSTSNDSNTSRITATPSSTLSLGTGDYTVEMWVKSRSSTSIQSNGNYRLFEVANSSGGERIAIRDNGYGDSRFSVMENGSQLYRTSSGTNPYTGEWEWIQIVRDNGATKAYVNGSERGSASSTTDISGINKIYIGSAGTSGIGYGFNGNIRDFRISNIARSTTVPTEPLESDSNTLILACNKGHLIEQGPNSIPLTLSSSSNKSDPFPSTSSPYDYNEYSAADHGGSVHFDGTGDGLVTSTIIPATGNFTIEGWVYSTSTDSSQVICGQRTNSGSGRFALEVNAGNIKFFQNGAGSGHTTSNLEALNKWCHFVLMRTSNNLALYVNGERKLNTTSGTFEQTNFEVGTDVELDSLGLNYGLYGFVSDLQVSLSAKYSEGTSVTVPTAPLSSTGTELHIKGTDASIIDKSQGANLKLVGNTTGSTTQVKFSNTKSMYFDGTGDGIVVPHRDDLNLNSCDWTIEYWFNLPNPGAIRNWTFIQKGDNSTVRPYGLSFRIDNSNGVEPRIFPSPNNSSQGQISNNAWQTFNAWHHVAFVRVNSTGVITRYIDGTANGTVTSDVATNTEDLYIGTMASAGDEEGYIQDLRISKGKAHYTANFTPPTAPLEG